MLKDEAMLDEVRRMPADLSPDDLAASFDVEEVLACPIDDSLALIVGIGDAMSGTLPVFLNGDKALGTRTAVIGWPLAARGIEASHGFVAAVPLAVLKKGRLGTLLFRTPAGGRRYDVIRRPITLEALVEVLSSLAGPALPSVVDGLVQAILPGPLGRRRLSAITTLVEAIARHDGFVEIVGVFEDGGLYVQGWSAELGSSVGRVLISGASPQIAESAVALFSRDDLGNRAHGFAATLLSTEPIEAAGVQRLFFRNRNGWSYADIYGERTLVGPRDTPGYVRAILPRTRGVEEVMTRLRAAAYRFEGYDTVSTLPIPVRAAFDSVYRVDGCGLLVNGWLLDPEHRVEAVHLRRRQEAVRLDPIWTRIDRPDVTGAFDQKPPFGSSLDGERHMHGFVAYAPGFDPGDGAPVYLELTLTGLPPAYLPVSPKRLGFREAVTRQLRAVNPRAPSVLPMIERHLAPLVESVVAPRPAARSVTELGAFGERRGTTLVIGAGRRGTEFGPLLALLALDPQTRGAPIVLAGAAETLEPVQDEILRLAGFYGLGLRLVAADHAADVFDAFLVGTEAAASDDVVLFSAGLLPQEKGWFGRLTAVMAAFGRPAIVSPTLVYEDDSVRWAGRWIGEEEGAPALVDRYVGYPIAVLAHAEAGEVAAANLECCALPRTALGAISDFSRGYLGSAERGVDLALKLARAGLGALWLPDVHVLAPDETTTGEGAGWAAHVRRIDRRVFDARWSAVIAGMGG